MVLLMAAACVTGDSGCWEGCWEPCVHCGAVSELVRHVSGFVTDNPNFFCLAAT